MVFEALRYEHLAQIAQIEKDAFDEPWSVAMFLPELEDENAVYVVGVENGAEVLCYGGFHRVLDEGHITNIAVRADRRSQGIGKALVAEMIMRAKQTGVARMTLEVKDNNIRAVNLYKSFGFEVEGIRKRYYANRYDALVMWLTIGED